MKKLPSIYKEKIKLKNNNKEYCYIKNIDEIKNEINNLFKEPGPIYDKKVLVKTPFEEFETYLFRKRENELITTKDEIIKIEDIISIKRIS